MYDHLSTQTLVLLITIRAAQCLILLTLVALVMG